MKLATAGFNGRGSPVVEFTLAGSDGVAHTMDGIIDTGFSGFILLPLVRFIRLKIPLEGTFEFGLADGQRQNKAVGLATASLAGRTAEGGVFLDMNGPHTLLGMGFLRALRLGLVVGSTDCFLCDEKELIKQMSQPGPKPLVIPKPVKVPEEADSAFVEITPKSGAETVSAKLYNSN